MSGEGEASPSRLPPKAALPPVAQLRSSGGGLTATLEGLSGLIPAAAAATTTTTTAAGTSSAHASVFDLMPKAMQAQLPQPDTSGSPLAAAAEATMSSLPMPLAMPRDASMSGTSGQNLAAILSAASTVMTPVMDKKLAALRDGSMNMSRFDSGGGSMTDQPSGDSLNHLPSQLMNTTFGAASGAAWASDAGITMHGGHKDMHEPPAVLAKRIKNLAKLAKKGYRKVGVEKLPKAVADDNYDGQEDLASEFGQLYYPHGFRKVGERVYDAIRRWFTYFESEEALKRRTEMKQQGRLGKKYMANLQETISRNIYNAFLHDLYAQQLRGAMNWIALPLIFINAVSSALGAFTFSQMSETMFLAITITQILLGVIAAVLVAVQKFFQFAEKAAIHESIKEAYFEAVTAETLLIYDLSVDEVTGMVVSSNGLPLKGDEIKLRLDKLYKAEKRLEGTPDEPVPEAVAGKLQPFVSKLQKEGYDGRWNLVNFPPVLGLKSYFLDVPQMSGCCSLVRNGVVRCQLGHNCQPINHDMPKDGWTMLCCGSPLLWTEGKGHVHKTSARLTAENLERMAREKEEQFRQNVPKGIKRWRKKAIRKIKGRALGEGVEDEACDGAQADVEADDWDVERGGHFPGRGCDEARGAYLDHLARLDELEDELEELERLEADREDLEAKEVPPEHLQSYLSAQYEHWREYGNLAPRGAFERSSDSDSSSNEGAGRPGNRRVGAEAKQQQQQQQQGQQDRGYSSFAGQGVQARTVLVQPRGHSAGGHSHLPPTPPLPPLPGAPSPPPPLNFTDSNYQPLPNADGQQPPPATSPFRLLAAMTSPRLPLGPSGTPTSRFSSLAIPSPSLPRAPMPSPSHPLRTGPRPIAEALEVSPFETGQAKPDNQQPLLHQDDEEHGGDEDSEEESVKPMSDVATEFGEAYYGPSFRLPGEKVKHAVVRFWQQHPDGTLAAFNARQDKRKTADKCKAFLRTLTEAMSRNLYLAILHDLYAQRLKSRMNWISMPLIFMNSFSAVLASASLADLPSKVLSGMSLSTTGINVVAAVLVAMQKFFMFAEKAALHDAIKKAHYEAYTELSTLMVELTVDPDTKVIMDTSGMPISNEVITRKLVEMAHIEKKLEGTPDEPVPESIARELQPYVSKLQDEGYDDRLALFRFPPVIGIRSYFLEVPEKTGLCSFVCDGVVRWQWGSSCKPINHEVTQVGCELLCCGSPCIVCASDEHYHTYENRMAQELWQKEAPRAVADTEHTGKALIDAPETQVVRRSKDLVPPAEGGNAKRGSKEIAAVRSNQVAPEPAPASSLERASPAREQEMSQITSS